ncbi:MAG: type II toxin-antitoxin system RelE/ParE family toxin [Allosphingosinicella sp.]
MRLRYRSIALADIKASHEYIARDNPVAASRVVRRIEKAIDRLRILPLSGRPGVVKGTRILVVPGLPYVAIYRVVDDFVDIVAVLHTARRRRSER